MKLLLSAAGFVDRLNDGFGWIAEWAAIGACVISAGNALVRYTFNLGSNAWLEIQWYLFAACVMFGVSQVLRVNEHVCVDLADSRYSARGKVWVDLFGLIFFLLPVLAVMLCYSRPLFVIRYTSGEMSQSAGGLIRWPAMLTLPLGFGLLLLQGLAEIVKRVAWLRGEVEMDTQYERPTQ